MMITMDKNELSNCSGDIDEEIKEISENIEFNLNCENENEWNLN